MIPILFLFVLIPQYGKSQQLTVYNVPFETNAPQSMWGPNGINVGINNVWNLFGPVGFGGPFGVGDIFSAPFGAGDFGAELAGSFQFDIGCEFALENFTLGQVEVDYPIEVTIDVPTDLTYDQGDNVDVETSYTLESGWALDTYYPNPGTARLTLNIGIGASLSLEACFISCFGPIDIIPGGSYVNIPIDIFNLDFDMTDGDGMDVSLFNISGFGALFEYDIPDTLFLSDIPGDPLAQFGLSGWFTPPHVYTTAGLYGPGMLDIEACGESQYVEVDLEIFDLLSNIPYFSWLAYLNDSYEFSVGPLTFEFWWNIFTASLNVGIYNKQCFNFEPTVYGRYEFPVPVEYQIIDGVSGAFLTPLDTSSIISMAVGNTLRYKFPCYFDELDITPTFSIDGQLTNHTYDSIPLSFNYSGLAMGIDFDDFTILPPLPPLPYPCGIQWCSSWGVPYPCGVNICYTQAFGGLYLYDIVQPFSIGPFIGPASLPIASVSYNWLPIETWSLGGFDEYTMPPFHMQASVLGASNTHIDVACHGDNTGSIDVSFSAVSPALPFTYQWTNGATTEDLTGLPAGPYQLSAFDANGCQHFTGATILEPNQPLSITPTSTDKSCNGGVNDGSISLLVQGGTPPYTASWSNGANTINISVLAAGTYTGTITDSKGCQEVVSVTINEPNMLGQVAAITNVLCKGGSDGDILVDVFGGTQPYAYNWNSGQTTEDIYNVTAGNYQLVVTDAKGCTSTNNYIVNEPATDISLTISGVDILCKGASTGSVDLTVSGGTPGYSYQWSNAQNIIIPYQTEDLTNVIADTYTVLVTDNNGCTETINQTLSQPLTSLTSIPIITHVNCFGDATGAVNSGVSGGTPGYTYVWSNGSSSAINNGLTSGSYTLDVTDNNGCLSSYSYTVTEPTQLVLTTTSTDVLCYGDATGETTVSASGGTTPYNYLWSNGVSNFTNSNVVAGTYSVTVTDAVGCVATANQPVTQPLAPLSVNFVTTDVSCFGGSDGIIDMTASDGTSPYTYVWATSGSVILVDTTEDVSGLPADTYLLTITDDHGCVLNSSTVINQPLSPLELSAVETDVLCLGGNNGAIDLTVTGGTAAYTYLWSNGSATEDINTLFAGAYDVTVTDANGCVETATYNLTEPPTAVSITLELHDVNCNGGADGYILSETTGGVGPYTYLWSNGATTADVSWLTAGTYTVTVTDANGCTAFTGGVIKEPATTISVSYATIEVSCFGGSDGVIGIGATGGVEPYYYSWGNQNLILLSAQSTIIDQLTAGDYLIHVEDANGCYTEETITVIEPTLLESSFTSIDVLCYGDQTGSIDVTTWGGSLPYTYLWSNGETTEDISNLGAGWYYYEITDGNGCTTNDSVRITQPFGFWSSYAQTGLSCMDQTDGYIGVEVGGGVEPYVFLWNTGEDSYEIFDLSAGNYSVIFTDANGCSDTLEFVIDPVFNSCIDVPNTFTPNGDDYNDTWYIENLELYPNAEVIVFNKWGNQLFKNDGVYQPWDGTVNGQPLPSEVYYYIILLNNAQGDKYTGVVTIVR